MKLPIFLAHKHMISIQPPVSRLESVSFRDAYDNRTHQHLRTESLQQRVDSLPRFLSTTSDENGLDANNSQALLSKTPDGWIKLASLRFGMLTIPAIALISLFVVLALVAFCHFRQGRQHKDHASRKGPDDSSPP